MAWKLDCKNKAEMDIPLRQDMSICCLIDMETWQEKSDRYTGRDKQKGEEDSK